MNENLTLTDSAAQRIAQMQAQEGNPALKLRLRVDSGGCSGFSYVFDFDDQKSDDDVVIEHGGKQLLIDPVSLEFVKGAVVDYVNEMIGSYFAVKNPQAKSSCGCGTSFSL